MFVYCGFVAELRYILLCYELALKKVKQAGQCVELNECLSGLHDCDANASCLVSKADLPFTSFQFYIRE